MMRIYLDAGSIHGEMSRRHPEIQQAVVWLNNATTEPHFASLLDMTGCVDGPADIVWSERRLENYYGFQVEMLRLVNVPAAYWRHFERETGA